MAKKVGIIKPQSTDSSTFVTIEFARQKLGKRGERMKDKEISNLLDTLRLLCNKTIDAVVNECDKN